MAKGSGKGAGRKKVTKAGIMPHGGKSSVGKQA